MTPAEAEKHRADMADRAAKAIQVLNDFLRDSLARSVARHSPKEKS